jgi:hypothetical protein
MSAPPSSNGRSARPGDRVIGIALCVLSIAFVLIVVPRATIPGASLGLPSAFMPTAAAVVLGVLAVLLALVGGKRRVLAGDEDYGHWGPMMLSVALISASIAVMAWIGYLAGAVLLVAALMLQLGVRSPLQFLVLPITSALIGWVLARHVLQLPLP